MKDPSECFVCSCIMADIPLENIPDVIEICDAHSKAEVSMGNFDYTSIDSLREFIHIVQLKLEMKRLETFQRVLKEAQGKS